MSGTNHISQYGPSSVPVQTGAYEDGRPIYTFYATPATNAPTFNVGDYGAVGDGVADDTAAIQAAINAANAAGGGAVSFPAATYLTQSLTLYSYVHLRGAGINATTLKLKGGANADILWGGSANAALINPAAALGSGAQGTLWEWGVYDLSLDGNKAAQTAGPSYGIRQYGYGFVIQNVRIHHCYSGGILTDWNGGNAPSGDQMEASVINLKVHDCDGTGIQWSGPHDSLILNTTSFINSNHQFHFCPNAVGTQVTNAHAWGAYGGSMTTAYLCEANNMSFANCQAEGSGWVQVAMVCIETTWDGGRVFSDGANGFLSSGFKIGQVAGETAIPGQIQQSAGLTTVVWSQKLRIQTGIQNCQGANGALWLDEDAGWSQFDLTCDQTSGTGYTGFMNPTSNLNLIMAGLTADGSVAKGGGTIISSSASTALSVRGLAANTDAFSVNIHSNAVEVVGASLRGWNNKFYGAVNFQINADGNGSAQFAGSFAVGQSATAAALATGGTITTSAIGVARVAPAAAVTGIILQAGTIAGQMCMVVNESAYTVTFDVAVTSHVADGTSDVIAATSAHTFVWDSGTSLWYHCT